MFVPSSSYQQLGPQPSLPSIGYVLSQPSTPMVYYQPQIFFSPLSYVGRPYCVTNAFVDECSLQKMKLNSPTESSSQTATQFELDEVSLSSISSSITFSKEFSKVPDKIREFVLFLENCLLFEAKGLKWTNASIGEFEITKRKEISLQWRQRGYYSRNVKSPVQCLLRQIRQSIKYGLLKRTGTRKLCFCGSLVKTEDEEKGNDEVNSELTKIENETSSVSSSSSVLSREMPKRAAKAVTDFGCPTPEPSSDENNGDDNDDDDDDDDDEIALKPNDKTISQKTPTKDSTKEMALWQFLLSKLVNGESRDSIRWVDESDFIFRFVKPLKVAKMWSNYKRHYPTMSYQSVGFFYYCYCSTVLLTFSLLFIVRCHVVFVTTTVGKLYSKVPALNNTSTSSVLPTQTNLWRRKKNIKNKRPKSFHFSLSFFSLFFKRRFTLSICYNKNCENLVWLGVGHAE